MERHNPTEQLPQYIANVSVEMEKRFEEIGITNTHRRGWDREEDFLNGDWVLITLKNVPYNLGLAYDQFLKPEDGLKTFFNDVEDFKRCMEEDDKRRLQ